MVDKEKGSMKKLKLFENYLYNGREVDDNEFKGLMFSADDITNVSTILDNLDKILPTENYTIGESSVDTMKIASADSHYWYSTQYRPRSVYYKGTELCIAYPRMKYNGDNGSVKLMDVNNTNVGYVIRSIRNDADYAKEWLLKKYGS